MNALEEMAVRIIAGMRWIGAEQLADVGVAATLDALHARTADGAPIFIVRWRDIDFVLPSHDVQVAFALAGSVAKLIQRRAGSAVGAQFMGFSDGELVELNVVVDETDFHPVRDQPSAN